MYGFKCGSYKVCTFQTSVCASVCRLQKCPLSVFFADNAVVCSELACVVTTEQGGEGIDTGEAGQVLLTAVFPVMSVTDQVRERCWCK